MAKHAKIKTKFSVGQTVRVEIGGDQCVLTSVEYIQIQLATGDVDYRLTGWSGLYPEDRLTAHKG